MTWFEETLHAHLRQRFRVTREVYRERTGLQELVIFETPFFGRVLALDGVIQTTERDEFFYHEAIVHVPLFGHGAARRVLIIGGGDGGCLREALKHPVETVTMVEIDRKVIDLSLEYLPTISAGAFDDPRTRLLITDGIKFVHETAQSFDVIIVDSTDPQGPGAVLFTPDFYAACRDRLSEGGVLVTQNGVPYLQPAELQESYRCFRGLFDEASCYLSGVPSYIGGPMAYGWAVKGRHYLPFDPAVLRARVAAAKVETRYYSPEFHAAAFHHPPAIRRLLADA